MFKELSQLGSLLKQAQSISGRMQEAQQRLAETSFDGASSSGDVRVVFSGQGRLLHCHLAPSLVSANERERLEGEIVEAINLGLDRMKRQTAETMSEVTGGLDLGGLGALLGQPGK